MKGQSLSSRYPFNDWCAALALGTDTIHGSRDLEGFKIPLVYFADGEHRMRYQPPQGWQVSGRGQELNLYPPIGRKR